MKKLREKLIKLAVTLSAVLAFSIPAFAATGRIAFSDPSTTVGEDFSVTFKFTTDDGSALGDTSTMLSYDPDMLEFIGETDTISGGAGAIRVRSVAEGLGEEDRTLNFHALKPGTTTITISSWTAYDNYGSMLESVREGSSSITIAALPTSSDDATLSSLTVAPGNLSPSFSPSTDSYTVTVGLDTTEVAISAVPNNDGATVTVDGGTDLQEGSNTVTCHVLAQNGSSSRDYIITVNRVEGGEQTETAATNAEPEVLAELTVTARRIRIIDLPEGVSVPEGFRESSIAIGDTKVPGWTWAADETPSYCVFYGMNDNGEQNFYRYDLSEKTIQRYFDSDNMGVVSKNEYDELTENYNNLVSDYNVSRILMIVFLVLVIILLILVVILMRRSGSSGSRRSSGSRSRGSGRGSQGRSSSRRDNSRASEGRKLSKEERYMMGEDDEYEEDTDESYDDEDEDTYYYTSSEDFEGAAAEETVVKEDISPQDSRSKDDPDDDFEFFDL